MKPLIPEPWIFDPPSRLRLIDVRSIDGLAPHADAWAELLLQSPAASPMLSYPQISAFLETQLLPSESWLCLFAYEGDRLIGVMPLIAARAFSALGFSILLLKTPYNVLHTSGVDCLTLHGREEILELFVAYLSRIPRTWPLIRMRELPEYSPSMVYQKRGGTKLRTIQRLSGGENYIEVPADYDTFHAGLSSNFRRQLKRGSRKLEELDDVRFHCPEETRATTENLRRFEEVEHAGWKGAQHSSIKALEGSSRFFTLAAERFSNDGWMEWNFLETGDMVIGAHYGVRINRTLFLIKIGYDEKYATCSPGNLLLAKAIEYASKAGNLDEINCVADCTWHKNWNMQQRPLHDLIILPKVPVISALLSSLGNSNFFRNLTERIKKTPLTHSADCHVDPIPTHSLTDRN